MGRIVRQTKANECRRCSTFCDRVIAPSACVAQACPFLYSYDDPLSGRRFMGCMQKVFATSISVANTFCMQPMKRRPESGSS